MDVTPDQELMLIFGALHLVALVLGGVLFVMFLRSETVPEYRDGDDEDDSTGEGGGGGNDRLPKPARPRPGGGVPLPDAIQPSVRLRGHGRLSDAHPTPPRRPAREPRREPARK